MKELSMTEFATHLLEMAVVQHEVNHHALEKAAQVIEKRAKEKIGEYQAQIGEFAGWAELADSTKADRERQGFPADEPLLRTGHLRDSIQHMVEDRIAQVGSNEDVAVYQELGTEKIPPRSFLGGAAAEKAGEVVGMLGETLVAHLSGQGVFGGKLPISR